MSEVAFVRKSKPDWDRLERYVSQIDGRGTKLGPHELFKFISLYRKVTGDLARARTLNVSTQLVTYLNALVGRVHFRVYAGKSYSFHKILDFYREGLPRTVRRLWRYVLASAALLLLPAFGAYLAVSANPHYATAFAPPGYVEQIEQSFGESFGKEERGGGAAAMMTSFYIVNNIQVSFWAFSLGFFLGLGSMYVLVVNGMILGGVSATIADHGFSYNFWSFVASHGGIELGAIVLSGAAGLRIGLSLVNPGLLTRKAALAAGSRDAGLVMFGVITMLLMAAGIEAWISPSTLSNPVKLSIGVVNLLAVLGYYTLAGRGRLPRGS